jgi:DNA-binding HxlR family transcriptional regulator
MKNEMRSPCPISFSLDVFGDKWTLLILRDMLVRKKQYYKDFLNSGEGISTNILADRLELLIQHGLATKADDPEHKSYTIYTPTKKAEDLRPILYEMKQWGLKHNPKTWAKISDSDKPPRDAGSLKKKS